MIISKSTSSSIADQKGFVLVTALLIMLVLTIIGIAATTNTSLELQIAGNDKVHKQSFYGAEGAAILGVEILEQNLNCPTGFSASDTIKTKDNHNILVDKDRLDFWRNPTPTDADILDNTQSDISFPVEYDTTDNIDTYVKIGGAAAMLPGGSLQMAAGYEGKGKSAAGAGVARYFNVYSRHEGRSNSQAIIAIHWRHIVGNESTCNY